MAGLPAEETYLQGGIEFLMNDPEYSEISAVSWEAAIQRQIEQELYPSVEVYGQKYFFVPESSLMLFFIIYNFKRKMLCYSSIKWHNIAFLFV